MPYDLSPLLQSAAGPAVLAVVLAAALLPAVAMAASAGRRGRGVEAGWADAGLRMVPAGEERAETPPDPQPIPGGLATDGEAGLSDEKAATCALLRRWAATRGLSVAVRVSFDAIAPSADATAPVVDFLVIDAARRPLCAVAYADAGPFGLRAPQPDIGLRAECLRIGLPLLELDAEVPGAELIDLLDGATGFVRAQAAE